MTKRIYNLKKQAPDERDYSLSMVLLPHEAVKLPKQVDLRPKCPPIYDQGELGSCTANAGVAALVMLMDYRLEFSRLDQYYNERVIENDVATDSGAQMRDIGNAMNKYGVCREEFFPYDISKFANPPSAVAVADANSHKIKTYYAVANTDQIKQVIALKQQPVLIGIDIYESFESQKVAETGIVPVPKKKEQLLGGHAVCAVGYDDTKKWFIMRNSWGNNWGDKGYFYLPYKYFTKGFASDFWVLQN